MLAATLRSRKPGQFQSRLRRPYRPLAEGLEDRLVLSRLEILSQSALAEYSLFMTGWPFGPIQQSDSTTGFPVQVGAGGGSDGLASADVGGGIDPLFPGTAGLGIRAQASVANGHWGFTDKKLTA